MGTVEGAAPGLSTRESFDRVEILGLWGVAVELDDEFEDEPRSTRDLIERQRKLGESPLLIDRLTAMVLGGALGDRLNGLSDRQIGQLLFDFCWAECYFNSPELIIVTQAIDRLRRSTGGGIGKEEAQENPRPQPVCPKCGNEMFLHYGIDEPDFWLCDALGCRHKRYVGEQ
jgi:hypothetical protein